MEQDKNNLFAIINTKSEVQVICSSQVVKIIPPISVGRIEITLPCHCSAQEPRGGHHTLVPALPTCIMPSGVSSQVIVRNDWADDNFSAIHLFAPSHHVPQLLQVNVTLPPLDFVTVAPEKIEGSWHELPLLTSGKLERIVWCCIFVMAIIGLLLYLENRFKIFTACYKVVQCCKCVTCCKAQPGTDDVEMYSAVRRPPPEHAEAVRRIVTEIAGNP